MYKKWRESRQRKAYADAGIVLGDSVLLADGVDLHLQSPFFATRTGSLSVGAQTKLSNGCVIHCYGGDVRIGANNFFGPHCVLYGHGNISIGDNCLIAMGCKIVASNHTVPPPGQLINQQEDELKAITIGNDVWLGADVKILAGVSIGDGAIIGAGSVVTKSIPANYYALGVPAKVVKERK